MRRAGVEEVVASKDFLTGGNRATNHRPPKDRPRVGIEVGINRLKGL